MKPILFSTPMVQAILTGNKTQTRRVIKPQPADDIHIAQFPSPACLGFKSSLRHKYGHEAAHFPKYQPGDILWVREMWQYIEGANGAGYAYRAGGEIHNDTGEWRPSIHMPRAAARIFLRVTDVRAERVQEISIEDAILEGCTGSPCNHFSTGAYGCTDCMNTGWLESPQVEFMALWEQINAKRGYGWDKNPWVWVYTFERITESEARKEPDHDEH